MRRVIIHRADPDETGFWAECPSLGVVSQGETMEETIANIREAIALWLEVAAEYGDPIPPSRAGT
jgi:predicted RNase H-like HicB family nuclease